MRWRWNKPGPMQGMFGWILVAVVTALVVSPPFRRTVRDALVKAMVRLMHSAESVRKSLENGSGKARATVHELRFRQRAADAEASDELSGAPSLRGEDSGGEETSNHDFSGNRELLSVEFEADENRTDRGRNHHRHPNTDPRRR
ncbi:hypothetical protein [Staphylospora marina]|uniref:hypothetical protein n=1 Tax=Staphylospora marina TaxID=2490858 RepID=UPI000F5C0935|nr:hypothetical protein [Staphylospora marina]